MKDMLTEMLTLQNQLQVEAYDQSPSELDGIERIEFIRNMVLALTDELHEMLNETGWKPWAITNHVNRDAYANELVDAWHFMMNLMIVMDIGPDELYVRYLRKREKNLKRQDEGYDGLDKCPICKRAYDDEAVACDKIWHESANYFFCATLKNN